MCRKSPAEREGRSDVTDGTKGSKMFGVNHLNPCSFPSYFLINFFLTIRNKTFAIIIHDRLLFHLQISTHIICFSQLKKHAEIICFEVSIRRKHSKVDVHV